MIKKLQIKGRDGESRKTDNGSITRNIILKRGDNIIDGAYDFQSRSTSSFSTKGVEITEKYSSIYPNGSPKSEAEFFYENELFKKKISESMEID